MCEYSEKLVAWLDRELPSETACGLEEHLDHCPECARRIAAYEEINAALAVYGDQVMAISSRRRPRWRVVACAGAVAAAVLVLAILLRRPASPAMPGPPEITQPAAAFVPPPVVVRSAAPRHVSRSVHPHARQQLAQPVIEIAIPAEAIFPPGSLPEGFQFVAAIDIDADGSAQSIRLRPY